MTGAADRDPGKSLRILEEERAFVGCRVVAIDVEEALVAFVALDVKMSQIIGPPGEARFEVLARSQIAYVAVQLANVQVVQLVAALVLTGQDPVIVRKIVDANDRIGPRVGQFRKWAASDPLTVGIEDAARVR